MPDGTSNPGPPNASDLLNAAWAVISNAGGGDWSKETVEWEDAARRWRDDYHAFIAGPLRLPSDERTPAHVEPVDAPPEPVVGDLP